MKKASQHQTFPYQDVTITLTYSVYLYAVPSGHGNQSKRPHSKTATTRTATLSWITTRTATLLWSKRPHCFGQNGHIRWVATKTATLHLVKTATLFLVKTATGRVSSEWGRFGYQNGNHKNWALLGIINIYLLIQKIWTIQSLSMTNFIKIIS